MTDYLDDRVSGDRYRAVEAERDRLKNLVEDQASAIDVAGREIDRLKAELEDVKNYRDSYQQISDQKTELLDKFQKDRDLWKSRAEKMAEALRKISKWHEGDKESGMGWSDMESWGAYAKEALEEYESK